METDLREYTFDTGHGRMDDHGREWFACDPYPTWYRWEEGKLITNGYPDFWD